MTQQVMTSAGLIKGLGTPGYGTSLPASPVDGQEYILVDSTTTPTYQWRFRYNAGSANTDKWEFIGGAPYHGSGTPTAVMNTLTQVAATGWYYQAASMAFTIPRAGVYQIHGDVWIDPNGAAAADEISIFYGSTANADSSDRRFTPTGTQQHSLSTQGRTTSQAASTVIGICASGTVGTAKINQAGIYVTPVRVS